MALQSGARGGCTMVRGRRENDLFLRHFGLRLVVRLEEVIAIMHSSNKGRLPGTPLDCRG